MKLLMISEVCTHPSNMGNRQRVLRECQKIKRMGWDIDFLYYGSQLVANIDEMREFFGQDHLYLGVTRQYEYRTKIKGKIRDFLDKHGISRFFPLRYGPDEWACKEVDEYIRYLVGQHDYDAVWLQYGFQSKSFDNIPSSILRVLDTQDRFAYRDRIFRSKGEKPVFFYTTKAGERRWIDRADVILAIQDEEKEYFKMLSGNNKLVFSLGDTIEYKCVAETGENSFGFVGSNNKPNQMGVTWFINEVLPIVRASKPDSTFYIAGNICDSVKDSKEYVKLGRVNDLQEFYEKIQFAVSPMQNGTGLNIKTIEALSYGKPLVATSVGAKGLSAASGAFVVADSASEFADSVVEMLENEAMRNACKDKAIEFVDSYNASNNEVLVEIEKMAMEQRVKK